MKLITLILSAAVALSFGPANAQIDDDCLTETVTQSQAPPQASAPTAETKDDYSPPEPEPAQSREVDTCASPRDGLESTDEGDRVMCSANATAR